MLCVAFATLSAPVASADPPWVDLSAASVHPGVQTVSPSGQCTANFVFYDGDDVFIGQAAHCTGLGAQTDTNGCTTPSLPLGTPVTVGAASQPATLAYSSWLTMQDVGETNTDACDYNDFALLRLADVDADDVNPSVPHWGGPTGLNTTGCSFGQKTFSYGNSSLRLGLALLSPHVGVCRGTLGGGWSHQVNTLPPDLPGDSGSAFLDSSGRALGNLSILAIGVPDLVYNGVSDISREIDYMRTNEASLTGVELALGTEPFRRFPLLRGLFG